MKIGVIISSNDAEAYLNAPRYANFCLVQKEVLVARHYENILKYRLFLQR
jgi:hypothetical protein